MISISVVCALPDRQIVVSLQVPAGTTALQAAELSGIQAQVPEIDLLSAPMGVFSVLLDGRGNAAADAYLVEEGDRIEIYRPLVIDPKQARLQRAAEARAKARSESQQARVERRSRQPER